MYMGTNRQQNWGNRQTIKCSQTLTSSKISICSARFCWARRRAEVFMLKLTTMFTFILFLIFFLWAVAIPVYSLAGWDKQHRHHPCSFIAGFIRNQVCATSGMHPGSLSNFQLIVWLQTLSSKSGMLKWRFCGIFHCNTFWISTVILLN